MKWAFLDTSVINRCNNFEIKGEQFSRILADLNLVPVIGMHTTYELARDFLVDQSTKATNLFHIIRDLKPKVVCQRPQMYVIEFNQLKSGRFSEAHEFLLPPNLLKLINQQEQV